MTISRDQIKHNFLKKVIFRLDYEGILEADLEKVILDLRDLYLEYGFDKMDNRIENQLDFQLKLDLNIPDENKLSVGEANKSIVYVFSSKNEIIELNKSFVLLKINIDDNGYKTFEYYLRIITYTILKLKSSSPYFRALRIGLRKINICFINDLSVLSRYFTEAAFNIGSVLGQYSKYKCTASNIVTLLEKDGFQINYVRNMQEGRMQKEDGSQYPTYQIVLDIDVYKEGNLNILPALENEEKTSNMLRNQNDIEFNIFTNSLTTSFIEKLKDDIFRDEHIEGVI